MCLSKRDQRQVHLYSKFRIKHYFNILLSLIIVLSFSACAKRAEEEIPAVFYPEPPQHPRLQFLTSISSEKDLEVEKNSFDDFLLGPDQSLSSIGRPYDVGSSKGKIYILDRKVNKILIVNLENRTFEALKDGGRGVLRVPGGIAVSSDDMKYIADLKRKQVVLYDGNNDFVQTYGDEEMFEKPVDVAIHENRLYVCDMLKHQILVLDIDSGELIMNIGEIGAEEGQFYKPTHIAVDDKGNLFVNDTFNFRVQQFDSEGDHVQTFGFHGDQVGGMARSKGLDVDRDGNLYVADAASEYVQIFNNKTQLLLFFGGPGMKRGNMYLPAGVHIDYENIEYFKKFADKEFKLKYLLYVCNMSGPNKVNVYGFGDWTGE
jgi:sugar lactone lactonase YvrE